MQIIRLFLYIEENHGTQTAFNFLGSVCVGLFYFTFSAFVNLTNFVVKLLFQRSVICHYHFSCNIEILI